MKFSQIFGFFKILSESNKVALKNAKSIAVIAALSLIASSILFMIFSCLYPYAVNFMTNSIMNADSGDLFFQGAAYFIVVFAIELAFLFAYITIIHASGVATVLASAASYSNNKLSLNDLYSSFKLKWRTPIRRNQVTRSRRWMQFLLIFAVALAVPLVMFYPNPVTIAVVSVLGVSIFVFSLYDSVVVTLASVIPVVEEACEAAKALEKAEKLVQGQRLHGFMVNLFYTLICVIICVAFWLIVGDKGSLNLLVYGLFFVNSVSLSRVCVCVIYTVYYFQCMEYHGQKIPLLGDFNYTAVSNDII